MSNSKASVGTLIKRHRHVSYLIKEDPGNDQVPMVVRRGHQILPLYYLLVRIPPHITQTLTLIIVACHSYRRDNQGCAQKIVA